MKLKLLSFFRYKSDSFMSPFRACALNKTSKICFDFGSYFNAFSPSSIIILLSSLPKIACCIKPKCPTKAVEFSLVSC